MSGITKEDRHILFNLLKVADHMYYGYSRKEFSTEPSFLDDKEEVIEEKANPETKESSNVNASVINTPSVNTSIVDTPNVDNLSSSKVKIGDDNHLIDEKGLSSNQLGAQTLISRLDIEPVDGIETKTAYHKDSYKETPTVSSSITKNTNNALMNESIHATPSANMNESIQNTYSPDSYSSSYTENLFATKENTASVQNTEYNNTTPQDTENNLATSSNATNIEVTSSHLHSRKCSCLMDVNTKILRCTRCGLARTRLHAIFGEGVEKPDVLVIGEAPGEDEDIEGRPFIGKAGQLLNRMLNSIFLDRRQNCYITNVVKCRPPRDRDPFPDEEDACISFLDEQINFLKPKIILCLDKVAIEKILNRKISEKACHGQFYTYKNIPIMLTYHPSALLRTPKLKEDAWNDLKRFSRKLDELKIKAGEQIDHVLHCLQ